MRRAVWLLIILTVLEAWFVTTLAHARQTETTAVRSTFLQHVLNYTTFKQDNEPPVQALFCFLESAPYTYYNWFDTHRDKTQEHRPVELKLLDNADALLSSRCQFLFVGAGQESERLFAMLSEQKRPLVSIGETSHFLKQGGLVSLVARQARIKVLVNRQQYMSSNVKFSARLLKHASFR